MKKENKANQDQKKIVRNVKQDKRQSRCPVFRDCGGCQHIDMPYKEQLAHKEKRLKELLSDFCPVEGIIGMEKPEYYRHKVHAVFTHGKKGVPLSGVYKEGTHYVVPVEKCLLENEKADEILATIRSLLASFKIKTYDEDTEYGLFRHALIRVGYHTGQIMVVLVLSSPILPSKNNFVKALRKEHPEITTIVLNVNDKHTSMVLGEKETVLYGKGYIEDVLCGKTFRISSKSFYQVNPQQTQELYQKAISYAGLSRKDTIIDAYCGIGTIGIIASDSVREVIGVELNPDAVRDAVGNVKANNANNVTVYAKDAGKFMLELAATDKQIDVVFMDPPRSGSTKEFMSSVCKLAPRKVVYISCNPDTLKRDLGYFVKHGYEAKKCVGVDMFPFTEHVETVCLLSKLHEAKHHVSVKLDMDELDLTSAESKATYEEIKKYVAEHNDGMKVSSLYIAQVKRKCGIELGENFNLPKLEDARQPQCPKDKEEAIVQALKHFRIV